MSYAIFRCEKLKSNGSIHASASHMMRDRPTPNADPELTHRNRVIVGSDKPAADVEAVLDQTKIPRKDSVRAIEVLATASPEWFEHATEAQIQDWIDRSHAYLADTFGSENLVHLQLHADETTPHLTGFVVPIRPDNGKLSAGYWLDGSVKLSKMQDCYADALDGLGIKRGTRGSRAKHTTIREYYGTINSQTKDLDDPDQAKKLAATAEVDRRKTKEYKRTADDLRELADQVRDVPLQDVADQLGLQRDRQDRQKWVDDSREFAITITGQKWFDHKVDHGGGGAIDLVKHVMRAAFAEAVSWLSDRFGKGGAQRAVTAYHHQRSADVVSHAQEHAKSFVPPKKIDGNLDRVRRYLIGRGIEESLIDQLIREKRIYSDHRSNVVMLGGADPSTPGSAELRGTGKKHFHGYSPGSSRDSTFQVRLDDQPPQHLVLVESGIDAMSYAQLRHENLLPGTVVASAGGARPKLPEEWQNALPHLRSVEVAYDNDHPGRKAAEKLIQALPAGFSAQARHPNRKDWNEEVQHVRTDRSAAPEEPGGPTEAGPDHRDAKTPAAADRPADGTARAKRGSGRKSGRDGASRGHQGVGPDRGAARFDEPRYVKRLEAAARCTAVQLRLHQARIGRDAMIAGAHVRAAPTSSPSKELHPAEPQGSAIAPDGPGGP